MNGSTFNNNTAYSDGGGIPLAATTLGVIANGKAVFGAVGSGAKVAVKVTDWPSATGLGEAVTTVEVEVKLVPVMASTTSDEAEAAKSMLPE